MDSDFPKGHATSSISINGVEDGTMELRSRTLGGTDTDEHEMRVLGRTQQLNVGTRLRDTSDIS